MATIDRLEIELLIDSPHTVNTLVYGQIEPTSAQWRVANHRGGVFCTLFDDANRNHAYYSPGEVPEWVPRPPDAWMAIAESMRSNTSVPPMAATAEPWIDMMADAEATS